MMTEIPRLECGSTIVVYRKASADKPLYSRNVVSATLADPLHYHLILWAFQLKLLAEITKLKFHVVQSYSPNFEH